MKLLWCVQYALQICDAFLSTIFGIHYDHVSSSSKPMDCEFA